MNKKKTLATLLRLKENALIAQKAKMQVYEEYLKNAVTRQSELIEAVDQEGKRIQNYPELFQDFLVFRSHAGACQQACQEEIKRLELMLSIERTQARKLFLGKKQIDILKERYEQRIKEKEERQEQKMLDEYRPLATFDTSF